MLPEVTNKAVKWLHHVHHDLWWQNETGISDAILAPILNVTTRTLSYFRLGQYASVALATKINEVARMLDAREAVMICDHGLIYIVPGPDKPSGPLLNRNSSDEGEWFLTSRCQKCAKNQYLPIILNDENYAACYHCIPPKEYKSLGAISQDGSLLRYALAEMGILRDIEEQTPPEPEPEMMPKPKKVCRPLKFNHNGWAKPKKVYPARFAR